MGPTLMVIGSGLVIVAVLFDLFIRLRMRLRAGDRQAFVRGGPNWEIYGNYRAAAIRNGWATWPAYAMWTFLATGVAALIVGAIAVHLAR
jgi:hypothetical protein